MVVECNAEYGVFFFFKAPVDRIDKVYVWMGVPMIIMA